MARGGGSLQSFSPALVGRPQPIPTQLQPAYNSIGGRPPSFGKPGAPVVGGRPPSFGKPGGPVSSAGSQNLQTAFDQAQQSVSPESRDTAAARVRSRLLAGQRGAVNQIQSAGTRNIGLTSALENMTRRNTQNAVASGLADVEEGFTNQQLNSAQTMGNIAGTQQGGGFQQQQMNQQQQQQQHQQLMDLFSGFAQYGNTFSQENPAFNQAFGNLINQVFGQQGIEPAGGGGAQYVAQPGQNQQQPQRPNQQQSLESLNQAILSGQTQSTQPGANFVPYYLQGGIRT